MTYRMRERCACGAEFEEESEYMVYPDSEAMRNWRERHAKECTARPLQLDGTRA